MLEKGRRRHHSGEFKQKVVEELRNEHLSFKETARRFGINKSQVKRWERIYLEEGVESLYIERRGRKSTGRPPKLGRQAEEDLIAENQRLRAEVDYLKNLNALVLERVQRSKK
jgi:Transposase.